MGFAAIVACLALAASAQDSAVGPSGPSDPGGVTVTLPPALSARALPDEPGSSSAPPSPGQPPAPASALQPPASLAIPAAEPPRAPRPLEDRPESGPSVGGFVVGSFAVVGLLGGAFLLLRRFGKNSRLQGAAGAIRILARKPLGQKQEILLVEVGTKVFMVGSTRDHLSALGEFSAPDEVAVLRANLPERKDDSLRVEFNRSLREGIRDEEGLPSAASAKEGPREERVFASIADELAEIRRTVRAWRA
jgi:flagellar biogenesis protein FliO